MVKKKRAKGMAKKTRAEYMEEYIRKARYPRSEPSIAAIRLEDANESKRSLIQLLNPNKTLTLH